MDPIIQGLAQKAISNPELTAKLPVQGNDSTFAKLIDTNNPASGNQPWMEQVMGQFGNGGPSMQAFDGSGVNVSTNREYQVEQSSKYDWALNYLEDFNRSQAQVDHIIESAMSGQKYSQTELLAVQKMLGDHTLVLDFGTKLVEQAVKIPNQTMQMQV